MFSWTVFEELTVYDAAYFKVAQVRGLTFVTDDRKLLSEAGRYVNVMRSNDI
ncbi:type II toxin-antitoxin system VapC family toxin [Vulcanisaeta thermophila]|uniref:type II toxin-antitoxin system VapC family toxin n=1 Tax=Vulcanisaeta thermophila TaxID=867917 RepID=UPI001180D74E|nr:type II toxin-antitoxin system VapC family toxin [Vulcanisaeta thermophila]